MVKSSERIDLQLSFWGDILDTFEDRTIFQTPSWMSFIAETQNAEPVFAAVKDGTRTAGYFSGLIVRKFGLKILGSPLPGWTTSYMGMNLSPGVSRRLGLEAVVRLAFEELSCVHIEIMDRQISVNDARELGFEIRTFAGFEIDLRASEDRLFANMTSACRRCIRRAEKCGVIIEEAHDHGFADDYYAQLQEVFRKQSLVPPYGIDRVRALIAHLLDTGHLLLLRARNPLGQCIATGIFPAMNDTMYFWGGASRRDSLGYRPNEVLHWHAMKYWKARGVTRYDMGGGGEYKRKYGGYEIAVPWIRKSRYPGLGILRSLAKQMAGWRQWTLGKAATYNRS
jgi:hypothetical protein